MTIRRIRLGRIEVLTTVLDPKRLIALEALLVYRYRWSVERLLGEEAD